MRLLREILFPLIAVLAAFVVGGIVVWIIGDSPFETYRLLIGSAFSWPDGIGYTLFNATPLIFTGLAVAVAFRCGLLNIGAEGQLYVEQSTAPMLRDRKSTRLNSSHGYISYAVFCLKKKKILDTDSKCATTRNIR